MSEKIIAFLVQFVTHVIDAGGYAGITALMGIESACIPLPSEIIMTFAGYLVYLGHFSLFWAATAGAVGCNLGSVVAYWIGAKGGLPLVTPPSASPGNAAMYRGIALSPALPLMAVFSWTCAVWPAPSVNEKGWLVHEDWTTLPLE